MELNLLLRVGALWLTLLLTATPVWAQINRFDNSFMAAQVGVLSPGYTLGITSEISQQKVDWEPNHRGQLGLALSFRDYIGISYAFDVEQEPEIVQRKGTTDYQDWRFAFNYEAFLFRLFWQEYRGFYLKNSSDVDPGIGSSDPLIQAPALEVRNQAVDVLMTLKPQNYSLTAALDQTARQEVSGGSFMTGLSFGQSQFYHPQALIPTALQSSFGLEGNIKELEATTFSIKGGYGHNFIYNKKWFANFLLIIGMAYQQKRMTYADRTDKTNGPATTFDTILSFGYNGDIYFSSLKVISTATESKTDSIVFNSNPWILGLSVGRRF